MKKTFKAKLIHSTAGCSLRQRSTVKGLGLTRMNQIRELIDTPAVRGMAEKIPHLVQIVEEQKSK